MPITSGRIRSWARTLVRKRVVPVLLRNFLGEGEKGRLNILYLSLLVSVGPSVRFRRELPFPFTLLPHPPTPPCREGGGAGGDSKDDPRGEFQRTPRTRTRDRPRTRPGRQSEGLSPVEVRTDTQTKGVESREDPFVSVRPGGPRESPSLLKS